MAKRAEVATIDIDGTGPARVEAGEAEDEDVVECAVEHAGAGDEASGGIGSRIDAEEDDRRTSGGVEGWAEAEVQFGGAGSAAPLDAAIMSRQL